jgi:hypothetical protein
MGAWLRPLVTSSHMQARRFDLRPRKLGKRAVGPPQAGSWGRLTGALTSAA